MIFNNRNAFLEAVRKGTPVGPVVDLHFPHSGGLFPIEAQDLARLLRSNSNTTVVLRMRHVDLQGDIRPLLASLSRQTLLRSFQAEFCNFPHRMAAVVVSALPQLETLNIVGHKRLTWRRPIPVQLMDRLVRRGMLKDLRLDSLGNGNTSYCDPQAAQNFLQTIAQSNLEVFWCLSSNLNPSDVATLLEQNTTLTDMRFSVTPESVSNVTLIAQALRHNRTLTNLGIRLTGDTDPDLQCFVDLLQDDNFILQDLIFARGTKWDADRRRHIPVYTSEQSEQAYAKMDFYLSLNRAGRGKLLTGTTAPTGEDWLSVIASQWSLSMVYYFCRINPTLVLPGALIPPPSVQAKAHDEAVRMQRFASLFPDAMGSGALTILGPAQLQDALMLGNPTITLQKLSLCFVDPSAVKWTDVATLLWYASQTLQMLALEGVEMKEDSGVESFVRSLTRAKHLTHLSIRTCKCRGLNGSSLTPVLSALPRFESLTWTNNKETRLAFHDMNQLLQKRPMTFLAVNNVRWNHNKEPEQFIDLVEQSKSLKVLRCEMQSRGFPTTLLRQLGQALSHNTSLEHLKIEVAPASDLTPLADSLRTNRTLTSLCVTGVDTLPNILPFVSVLERCNSTLKSLVIGTCDLSSNCPTTTTSPESVKHIRSLLQGNIARSRPRPLPKACYNPGGA